MKKFSVSRSPKTAYARTKDQLTLIPCRFFKVQAKSANAQTKYKLNKAFLMQKRGFIAKDTFQYKNKIDKIIHNRRILRSRSYTRLETLKFKNFKPSWNETSGSSRWSSTTCAVQLSPSKQASKQLCQA